MSGNLPGVLGLDGSPWLGLLSYAESDQARFFGREEETSELVSLIRRAVLTVVFGPSGAGKTSLLNAGLFPRLREQYFLPIPLRLDYVTPGRKSLPAQVQSAITAVIHEAGYEEESLWAPPPGEESLWERLHRVALWDQRNRPITPVLVFDQFEEIFTIGGRQPAVESFLADFAAAVENYIPADVLARLESSGEQSRLSDVKPRFKIVVTLREDYVSRLDGLRKRMPSIMHNRIAIEVMNGRQALDPVLGPARGIVDANVAEEIVRRVGSVSGLEADAASSAAPLEELTVEPALLSLICNELNARRVREKHATISSDLVSTAASDILVDFYERSFDGLSAEARVFVEDSLLTHDGFRTTAAVTDWMKDELRKDIEALVARRLLRSEERLGIPHVELTHDVITKVVRKSGEDRQERERRDTELARGKQEDERRRAELVRTKRRLAMVGAIAISCIVISVAAVVFYLRAERAKVEAQQARAESLVKRVATQVLNLQQTNRDDELSYLLLATAAQINPAEPALGEAAMSVLSQPYSVLALPTGIASPRDVALSRDGRTIAAVGSDAHVFVWREGKGSLPGPECPSSRCTAVALSPGGNYVAFGEGDGTVDIWRVEPRELVARKRTHQTVTGLSWKDDAILASVGYEGSAWLWNIQDAAQNPRQINVPPAPAGEPHKTLHSAAFSGDGRLAIGGYRSLDVWDAATGRWLLHKDAKNLITVLDWSSSGRLLAAGPSGRVMLLDESGQDAGSYVEPLTRQINAAAWIAQDRLAISIGNGIVLLQNNLEQKTTGEVLRLGGTAGTSRRIAADASGLRFVQVGDDQFVRVWTANVPTYRRTLSNHESALSTLAWSRDSGILVSGGADGRAVVWEVAQSPDQSLVLMSPAMPMNDLTTLGAESRSILGVGGLVRVDLPGKKGVLVPWSLTDEPKQQGKLIFRTWRQAGLRYLGPYATRIAVSPDAAKVATGTSDGSVIFFKRAGEWWSEDGPPLRISDQAIQTLSWKDANTLATIDASAVLRTVVNRKISSEGRKPELCKSLLPAVSTLDGRLLAMACDGAIHVRPGSNPQAAKTPERVIIVDSDVTAMNWSEDGRWLAFGLLNGKVSIADVQNPKAQFYSVPAHNGAVTVVSWSPDGKAFASGGSDKQLHLWSRPMPFQIDFCSMVNRPLRNDERVRYFVADSVAVDPCSKGKK